MADDGTTGERSRSPAPIPDPGVAEESSDSDSSDFSDGDTTSIDSDENPVVVPQRDVENDSKCLKL